LCAFCVVSALAGSAAAAQGPQVTKLAIAGARIHLPRSAYRHILGKPIFKERVLDPNLPSGWTRLIFANRSVSVYFAPKKNRATLITTWNKAYRTAAGIGPCSTVSELKVAYGTAAKPSRFNTRHGKVYAYTVGKNLLFASNNTTTIDAVVLYDGSDPKVNRAGGSLSYAGGIGLDERRCL